MPRLKDRYQQEIVPAMMERFAYDNIMQVPRLEKIVVNVGLGEHCRIPRHSMRRCGTCPPSPGRSR
jgi:large subunit ribosomal protein L5